MLKKGPRKRVFLLLGGEDASRGKPWIVYYVLRARGGTCSPGLPSRAPDLQQGFLTRQEPTFNVTSSCA